MEQALNIQPLNIIGEHEEQVNNRRETVECRLFVARLTAARLEMPGSIRTEIEFRVFLRDD